jgi:hypothetical protein
MRGVCLILACVFLLVSGCVRSLNPVLEDKQVVAIPELAGDWVAKENETVRFTPAEGNAFKVSVTDKEGKTSLFDARCGKVNDLTIIEITPAEMSEKVSSYWRALMVPAYSFFVITQTKPELHARTLDPDWLKEYIAIHPGELRMAGKAKDEGLIAASTEQVQQFIVKHWPEKEAWTDEIVLTRPEKPAKQP